MGIRPSLAGAALALGLSCAATQEAALRPFGHRGPPVAPGGGGPARWVPALYAAYDLPRSMETLRFADRFYRTPASEGYDTTLEFVHGRLAAAGFGREDGLELRVLVRDMPDPAWTPVAASLTLDHADGTSEVLHAFADQADVDRVMLPENAPSGRARGEAAFGLEEVGPGSILVTEARVRDDLVERARERGAAAIVSASLAGYNVDPFGSDRHLDAIQYRRFDPGLDLPVLQVSPRTHARIRAERDRGGAVQLSLEAEARTEERPLRALCAVVRGSERPHEAVVIVSHIDQPGASDNASGLSSLLESAVAYTQLLATGDIPRPRRSLVFLFGPEIEGSEMWLADTARAPLASFTEILTGDSPTRTGAVALLERAPDPGARVTLPPDEHTAWGAGVVDPDSLIPAGLNVIARCALADVTLHVGGAWRSADHPWEGGTDHDVYLGDGIPAVLFWHFAGLTYHTSLDRIDHIDPEEMRRTAVAVLAAALAIADPRSEDLPRYLASVDLEAEVREAAAVAAGEPGVAAEWRAWNEAVRGWFRELCAPPG